MVGKPLFTMDEGVRVTAGWFKTVLAMDAHGQGLDVKLKGFFG